MDDEPYENKLSVEELRQEVRTQWDRASAFRDDITTLPEAPSVGTLWYLADAAMAMKWPDVWSVGKALQRDREHGAIPFKTELECSGGLWVMIREGIRARMVTKEIGQALFDHARPTEEKA